jgi:hypothetical protein
MDYSTIDDRALDLGLFALDSELESGGNASEPMHYETGRLSKK